MELMQIPYVVPRDKLSSGQLVLLQAVLQVRESLSIVQFVLDHRRLVVHVLIIVLLRLCSQIAFRVSLILCSPVAMTSEATPFMLADLQ